jgi:hypothetical protein
MANTNSKPNAKRVCPNCGRKMVQKFIDVKQCKCGISWKEDIGDFQRTPDMAFALQPQVAKKGKKSVRTKKTRQDKKNTVIRNKDAANKPKSITQSRDSDFLDIAELSAPHRSFSPISMDSYLESYHKLESQR